MSIEIPNAIQAAGMFDGASPPATSLGAIMNSMGFQPLDPATTPLAPLGGFTRVSQGQYIMRLVEPIDILEAVVLCTPLPGGRTINASMVPSFAPFNVENNSCAVGCLDAGTQQPADMQYAVAVLRYATGPHLTP